MTHCPTKTNMSEHDTGGTDSNAPPPPLHKTLGVALKGQTHQPHTVCSHRMKQGVYLILTV